MADPRNIQDPQGAITLGAPFLGIQWMVGRTTERPIGLQGKRGAGKAMGKGRACPLGRSIHHRRRWLRESSRLACLSRFDSPGCGKFGCVLLGRRELLPQFQTEVPYPLTQDLPEFLPIGGVGTPTVGIWLAVFISQNGLKRSAMEREVEHI